MDAPQVKKEHYLRRKYDTLERFTSYYYQIDSIHEAMLSAGNKSDFKILEVGKGNGFVSDYLKKFDYNVTTADFDPELKPDVVADIRKLPFQNGSFDLVMACEVLEHLPFQDFEKTLEELKRVSGKHVMISLPYRSTGFEAVFKFPFVRSLLRTSFLDLFFRIPLKFGGIEVSKQHYWEIDIWKYSFRKIKNIIGKHFKIVKAVRPVLNHYHYFFLLEK